MSSLPLNTASALLSPANFEVRRASLWRQIAKSAKFADVRPASQLGVRPKPEMLSSGIAELDAITGGIPCGCITVICGGASSGKTSALLMALAKNTQHEGNCVLIDASDSFDPQSAAVAGVNFSRLLWVRCGGDSLLSAVGSFAQRAVLAWSCSILEVSPKSLYGESPWLPGFDSSARWSTQKPRCWSSANFPALKLAQHWCWNFSCQLPVVCRQ